MIKVYINYPNKIITVHTNPDCRYIQPKSKAAQRYIRVDKASLPEELNRFNSNEYRFESNPAFNDMWLEIDLSSYESEKKILNKIHNSIANHYKPIDNAIIKFHNC